ICQRINFNGVTLLDTATGGHPNQNRHYTVSQACCMSVWIRGFRLSEQFVMQTTVATTMTSTLASYLDNLILLPILIKYDRLVDDIDVFGLFHLCSMQAFLVQTIIFHPRDIKPRLNTPLLSIEGNTPALKRGICSQRIICNRTIRIFDLRRHLIVNIYFIPIHTSITDIPIMCFVGHV